jgi:putative membrane protein
MTTTFIVRVGLAGILMCAAAGGAWAQGKQGTMGKPNKAAQTFVTKAIQGNLAEVSMGQLAQEKGNSDGVRSFGQQLVTDHSAANQKLASIASGMGVTPPTEPSKQQKSDHDKMAKMSGDAFDRAFARHMVADHRKDIADYRKAAKIKDDQVASYATETLPTLEKHLQMAQSLNKSGGKAGNKPSM